MIRTLVVLLSLLAACRQAPPVPAGETGVDTADTGIHEEDDGDGVSVADGDCDEGDATVYPGAPEVCDEKDNDCDEVVDDGVTATFYRDADRDGFGNPADAIEACEADGYVANATDCNDRIAGVHPGATEACNAIDDDCNDVVDDGLTTTWYLDLDADGFGDPLAPTEACEQPAGAVTDATDCDDADATVCPAAAEAWYDGVDQDCDGADDYDADGDGDASDAYGGTDCDDADPARNGGVGC